MQQVFTHQMVAGGRPLAAARSNLARSSASLNATGAALIVKKVGLPTLSLHAQSCRSWRLHISNPGDSQFDHFSMCRHPWLVFRGKPLAIALTAPRDLQVRHPITQSLLARSAHVHHRPKAA